MTEETSVKARRRHPIVGSHRCYRLGLDISDGSVINTKPALEHLMVKDEVISLLAKLCFEDWDIYARCEEDLSEEKMEQLMKLLEEKGWRIDWDNRNIIKGPLREFDAAFQPTDIPIPYEVVEV